MLCEIGGWDRSESASEVHDGGVRLQCLVIVFAVEATVAICREEPPAKLLHRLHSTYVMRQVLSSLARQKTSTCRHVHVGGR